MDIETILTVNEVAEILQVKPITVREMFRERRLRAFKVGKAWRTTRQMLEEDIEALAQGLPPDTLPEARKPARRPEEVAGSPAPPAPAVPDPPPADPPPGDPPPPGEAPKQRKRAVKEQADEDDSQQFLF